MSASFLLLSFSAHADITGTVTLTGKPGSQDETFVAKASGCGESSMRHTENWKVRAKGEFGDVVVWIVDPKVKTADPTMPVPPLPEVRTQTNRLSLRSPRRRRAGHSEFQSHQRRSHRSTTSAPRHYDGPGKPPGARHLQFRPGLSGAGRTRRNSTIPGIYTLQCDVHGWMQCWVMVLKDDCFGVTDLDGKGDLTRRRPTRRRRLQNRRLASPFRRRRSSRPFTSKMARRTLTFQFDGTKSF